MVLLNTQHRVATFELMITLVPALVVGVRATYCRVM